jgi:hypothetical protein
VLPFAYIPQVPKALADKVRAYYSYVVEREVQADEADIIIGLSASLRTQVSMLDVTSMMCVSLLNRVSGRQCLFYACGGDHI